MTVIDPARRLRAIGAGGKVVHAVSNESGWRLGTILDLLGHHSEIGKPLGEGL